MRDRTSVARALAAIALALAAGSGAAHAQGDAVADTSRAVRPAPVRTLARASWTSDRMPLAVGDLITVIVDEQTDAREQVSRVAQGQRGQNATLSARINGDDAVKDTRIALGLDGSSRDVGEARHNGGLNAVLTVRVTELGADGLARVEGTRKVTVDGRPQQVTLKGMVRPQDIELGNRVHSSRVADAEIVYSGKKISPRTGFVGKLLGMLWP